MTVSAVQSLAGLQQPTRGHLHVYGCGSNDDAVAFRIGGFDQLSERERAGLMAAITDRLRRLAPPPPLDPALQTLVDLFVRPDRPDTLGGAAPQPSGARIMDVSPQAGGWFNCALNMGEGWPPSTYEATHRVVISEAATATRTWLAGQASDLQVSVSLPGQTQTVFLTANASGPWLLAVPGLLSLLPPLGSVFWSGVLLRFNANRSSHEILQLESFAAMINFSSELEDAVPTPQSHCAALAALQAALGDDLTISVPASQHARPASAGGTAQGGRQTVRLIIRLSMEAAA